MCSIRLRSGLRAGARAVTCETRSFCFAFGHPSVEAESICVPFGELKMGPSGQMDTTEISLTATRALWPKAHKTETTPTRRPNPSAMPRACLSFHAHLTHDLTRAASALPLHTAALALASFGVVIIQIQVPRAMRRPSAFAP